MICKRQNGTLNEPVYPQAITKMARAFAVAMLSTLHEVVIESSSLRWLKIYYKREKSDMCLGRNNLLHTVYKGWDNLAKEQRQRSDMTISPTCNIIAG